MLTSCDFVSLAGRVARVAKDQDGSRFIQQRLVSAYTTPVSSGIGWMHHIRQLELIDFPTSSPFRTQAFADGTEIQLVFDEAVVAIEGRCHLSRDQGTISAATAHNLTHCFHLQPSTPELWNDVYGNFIIQKLLEFGTCDMKEAIGKRLHSDVISLSTRVYGW